MKTYKKAMMAAGLAAAAAATPASADIFEYTMSNGDVLTINTETASATMVGANINATMTSSDFATFQGGEAPQFSFILDSLDGTRLIRGQQVTDNELNINTTHPQKLISYGGSRGRVNLWAWWGDPIIGGDYITYITSYTAQVPAPGALGLMVLGLGGVAFSRRRKKQAKRAAAAA